MPAAVRTEPAAPADTRTAVAAYLRPVTIDDAIECLSRPGAVLIGGGTTANRRPNARRITIVDLQALDLGRIEERPGGLLAIGATTTLQGLAGHPAVPPAVPETARREAPSTLRNLATVAGCVATSDPDSELLAVLLVHDAQVTLADASGVRMADLAAVLTGRAPLDGRIITAVTIRTGGVTSVARTGRTSADRAIVAAIARGAGEDVPRAGPGAGGSASATWSPRTTSRPPTAPTSAASPAPCPAPSTSTGSPRPGSRTHRLRSPMRQPRACTRRSSGPSGPPPHNR